MTNLTQTTHTNVHMCARCNKKPTGIFLPFTGGVPAHHAHDREKLGGFATFGNTFASPDHTTPHNIGQHS